MNFFHFFSNPITPPEQRSAQWHTERERPSLLCSRSHSTHHATEANKKTEHTSHDLGAPDLKRANATEQSHKQLSRNRYEHPLRQRFVAHGQRQVRGRSSYPTGTTPGNSENIAHVRKGFKRVFFAIGRQS